VAAARKLGPLLKMPLLICMADSDPALLPNLLCNIGRVAPNAIIRVLPSCCHWIQQDAPDEVNTLLRAFIADPSKVL
jgi:epoxide hydrolase 4